MPTAQSGTFGARLGPSSLSSLSGGLLERRWRTQELRLLHEPSLELLRLLAGALYVAILELLKS